MTFQNLFIPHDRSPEEKQWLATELAEQEVRYAVIVKAMEDITPQRDVWYAEFLQRIQDRGFNTDGDLRTRIPLADIPLKPNRPHKVVY
jgi:hypothetical protein